MTALAAGAASESRTHPADLRQQELLQGLRAGDERAYEQLVRDHGAKMLAVARRFLRSEHNAADAVQEAFLAAFRHIHTFAAGAQLGTWLHRIVVNTCLMKLRSDKSRPVCSMESLLPAFDNFGRHVQRASRWEAPIERLEKHEVLQRIRDRIDQLPAPYRTIVLLRDIEELDTQEVADRLGISATAVKVRLHRARRALRSLLSPIFEAKRSE